MPKARVNGIELYYELHGTAGETIVFANGVLADTKSWWGQVPVFAKDYRVLLFDFRGQGRSDKPDEPYTMEGHASDAASLLEALKVEQAHWVGVSYGGEIGMMLTLRHAELVKSLVVASAVSHVEPLLKSIIEGWMAVAQTEDLDLVFRTTIADIFSERFIAQNPTFLEAVRQGYYQLDYRAVVRLLEAFQSLNITAELHNIKAPTLVVCGAEDRLKPIHYSKIIHHEIARSEFFVIPDCGHALTFERPKEFGTLVLGFLEKLSLGGQT